MYMEQVNYQDLIPGKTYYIQRRNPIFASNFNNTPYSYKAIGNFVENVQHGDFFHAKFKNIREVERPTEGPNLPIGIQKDFQDSANLFVNDYIFYTPPREELVRSLFSNPYELKRSYGGKRRKSRKFRKSRKSRKSRKVKRCQ